MTVHLPPRAPSARHTTFDGFAAVALRAGSLEACFVPGAGMVGASLRYEGEELLARPDGLAAYLERGATLGIPFLHPWANRLEGWRYGGVELPRDLPHDEHGLPIHGILPRSWEVRGAGAEGERATLRATLAFDSPAFPFPHDLEQHVALSPSTLTIATTLRVTGGVAVPVAFGWHPYLRLPGVTRDAWQVTLPPRRHLLADASGLPTGEAAWERGERRSLAGRALDDGYDALGPSPRFAVAGGGLELSVTFGSGYPVAQVFAPPGRELVCFEPMTAPVNALASGRGLRRVAPGQAFRAAFTIAVE
jgi:aldose 1-epimerase